MSPDLAKKIKKNPKFQELVQKRNSYAWKLTFVMLAIYYSFILVIAFIPEILGKALGDSVITLGIPVGIGIILVAFLLTGLYTHRANTEFDTLNNAIKKELGE